MNKKNIFKSFPLLIMSICLVIGITVLTCVGISCWSPQNTIEYKLRDLSLGNSTSVTGTFFLGTGAVSYLNELNYYFYTEGNNGEITPRVVNYRYIVIYEDSKNIARYPVLRDRYYIWEVHIPSGSIKENYNIDIAGR